MEKIEIYIGCKIRTYSVPYATARAIETLLNHSEFERTERPDEERLKEWEQCKEDDLK